MTVSDTAVDALRRHAAERSAQKRRAVLAAVNALKHAGDEITIAGVARAAAVSREFIHTHPELHHAVSTAAAHVRRQVAATKDTGTATSLSASLKADRNVLLAQVERQRATLLRLQERVNNLERQRQQWLGDQLADLVIDPEAHRALRIENDRLAAQNAELTQRCEAQRRNSQQLERELAASRQAHAEDLASHEPRGFVTPLPIARRDPEP